MKQKTKEIGYDRRPRFGWSDELDKDPQIIWERPFTDAHPVVVIPLPFMSAKQRKTVREFVKQHWSGIP